MTTNVITIGETMALLYPGEASDRYKLSLAGAESNVAIGLSRLGHQATWISRLGDDHFGRFLHDTIQKEGVFAQVEWDTNHNTGLMIKEFHEQVTRIRYYRTNSAASLLHGNLGNQFKGAQWLHLTGITPALSDEARRATFAYIERAHAQGVRVSFDVNLRPVLWSSIEVAREVLVALCRVADVVFIGKDEAQLLTNSADATAFAHLIELMGQRQLIFKHGAEGVEYIDDTNRHFEPAFTVDVVELTGAGDAFAAGYLAGILRDLDVMRRLRLGHLMASRVVQVYEDIAPMPTSSEIAAALDEQTSK